MYRKSAYAELEMANAASWTPVNERRAKSSRGSIGSRTRRSIAMNAARRTPEPANNDTISELPQPSAFPRTRASDHQRQGAYRDIDVEDRLPAERVGERPADERSDGHRDADHRAVDTHGSRPGAAGGELLGDQGERDGEHGRPTDALERPRHVQERRVGRHRTER